MLVRVLRETLAECLPLLNLGLVRSSAPLKPTRKTGSVAINIVTVGYVGGGDRREERAATGFYL